MCVATHLDVAEVVYEYLDLFFLCGQYLNANVGFSFHRIAKICRIIWNIFLVLLDYVCTRNIDYHGFVRIPQDLIFVS